MRGRKKGRERTPLVQTLKFESSKAKDCESPILPTIEIAVERLKHMCPNPNSPTYLVTLSGSPVIWCLLYRNIWTSLVA